MYNISKSLPIALVAVVFTAGVAFAQTGGADVPTNAKKEGTMENGSSSTGMSKGEAKSDMKKGDMKEGGMKKDDKM